MSKSLKYMPVLRGRQEEFKVLKTFDFGANIYPCLEIIKEIHRQPNKPKEGSKPSKAKPKTFEGDYIPFIKNIKSERVFVDLPVHLNAETGMKIETFKFLRGIVAKREKRTEYMKKLIPLAEKVIPVVSSYSQITGKTEITVQENELRESFKTIAFRTFMKTFFQDMKQIEPLLNKTDYVIMDWDNEALDLEDGDQVDIVDHLKKLKCNVIVHRNSFTSSITNTGLTHGELVDAIDNNLVDKFKEFAGSSFSDYAGIKKDYIGDGGSISPGFVYYDAVNNEFYGYRYEHGGHKKGDILPDLKEFETRIVPAVISSAASKRMQKDALDFLGNENYGWFVLKNIHAKKESGRSAPKFKRIGMEHYLHCIKTRVLNGDFN